MPVMKFDQIPEETIGRLVDDFYDKIRMDPELSPIFLCAIHGDWDPHLATMRKFWSSVMLTSGRYKGDPVAAHRGVAGIEMKLFDRWRGLFHETSREVFVDDLADAFLEKAACITESLELALFYRPDRHWPGKAS
jgi:hemoglobin